MLNFGPMTPCTSRSLKRSMLLSGALALALCAGAQAPVTPVAGPDWPPSVRAWRKSEAAQAFENAIAPFLKKVGANPQLGFTIPRLEIAMVFVPSGRFDMGEDGGEDDERPQTPVTISRPYWVGQYEITQDEWREVMRLSPSHYKGGQRPVEFISWKAAEEFCLRVTSRERSAGRLPRGYVYRLPTEAEWEFACRLGVEGRAPGVLPETGWFAVNAKETTHPVGQKLPNAIGAYDMFGNVSEWCRDWFGNYPGTPVTDYVGPDKGDFRVARGGCSFDIAYGCRPSYRTGAEDIVRSAGIGMRLALAPEL